MTVDLAELTRRLRSCHRLLPRLAVATAAVVLVIAGDSLLLPDRPAATPVPPLHAVRDRTITPPGQRELPWPCSPSWAG